MLYQLSYYRIIRSEKGMTARQNYKKYGNPNPAKRNLNKISEHVKSFFVILRLIFENAFSVI